MKQCNKWLKATTAVAALLCTNYVSAQEWSGWILTAENRGVVLEMRYVPYLQNGSSTTDIQMRVRNTNSNGKHFSGKSHNEIVVCQNGYKQQLASWSFAPLAPGETRSVATYKRTCIGHEGAASLPFNLITGVEKGAVGSTDNPLEKGSNQVASRNSGQGGNRSDVPTNSDAKNYDANNRANTEMYVCYAIAIYQTDNFVTGVKHSFHTPIMQADYNVTFAPSSWESDKILAAGERAMRNSVTPSFTNHDFNDDFQNEWAGVRSTCLKADQANEARQATEKKLSDFLNSHRGSSSKQILSYRFPQ